jgi:predicted transposase YbfD/YdcC
LYEAVKDHFEAYEKHGGLPKQAQQLMDTDAGHGRVEQREYTVLPAPSSFEHRERWSGLKSLIRVHRQRHIKDRSTEETRYYISSLQPVNDIAHAIRSHWGVENKVHWVLDVTYRADDSRIRRDDGAPNLGLLRRMCLNLSRLHPKKDSMAGKLKGAGWDDAFRAELIFGHFA